MDELNINEMLKGLKSDRAALLNNMFADSMSGVEICEMEQKQLEKLDGIISELESLIKQSQ